MFYIAVDDIDAALAAIEAAGGTRLTERMPIPTVGWSAFFEDTERNKVGLFQADPDVPMPGGGVAGDERP
jgi:predicted enzyme related to lactoylglutathione lyase